MAEALPVHGNGGSPSDPHDQRVGEEDTRLRSYQEQYISEEENVIDEVELECSFKQISKKRNVFATAKVCTCQSKLTVRLQTLPAERAKETYEVLLDDILGVEIIDPSPSHSNHACTAVVHSFKNTTVTKKQKNGETVRSHEKLSVRFTTEKSFEENQSKAKKWKETVLNISRQYCKETFVHDNPHEREGVHNPHYLVLINPAGGKGEAVMLFNKEVQPMFDIAEITHDVVITERQGHAKDLVQSYDLSTIDGIVIASGDGLLYEVINGLMKRPDWKQAISAPIGIIPTGSGNALAACVMHESQESLSVQNAAFHIIRGGVQPMDLAVADTADGGRTHFSLLAGWGMISDGDIGSEKWRFLGPIRFQLSSLICILKKKVYHGRLWYLPADSEDDNSTSQTVAIPTITTPQREMNDQRMAGKCEQIASNSEHTSSEDEGTECNETPSQETKTDRFHSPPKAIDESNVPLENGSPSEELTPRYLVDPASDPPYPWKVIEGEFFALVVVCASHIGNKMYVAKEGRIGGGVFHICYLVGDVPRGKVIREFVDTEEGCIPDGRYSYILKAKAFRLAPVTQGGLLTLDGEVVPYGDLQCEMFQGLCRVMSRTRRK